MCLLYTATYPEMVTRLVMLDVFKPACWEPEDIVEKTRNTGMVTVISA